MTDKSDTFLTHVDASKNNATDPVALSQQILQQVRKEHTKIQEVVDAFRSKVDRMVDKQRAEYVNAYEHHIQDVQKTLHNLREKATEIANDQTKNERTEKLKADLSKYKNEALQLEIDSEELKVEMSKLVKRVYSVEKYRDWMIQRLRGAKKEYMRLVEERHAVASLQQEEEEEREAQERGPGGKGERKEREESSLILSIASASQYSIDLFGKTRGDGGGRAGERGGVWMRGRSKEEKFTRAIQQLSLQRSLPLEGKGESGGMKLPPIQGREGGKRGGKERESLSPSPLLPLSDPLGELVSLRTRKNELMNFLKEVLGNSLKHRPFRLVQARSLSELLPLLEASLSSLYDVEREGEIGGGEEREGESLPLSLLCELVTHPALYSSLLHLLEGPGGAGGAGGVGPRGATRGESRGGKRGGAAGGGEGGGAPLSPSLSFSSRDEEEVYLSPQGGGIVIGETEEERRRGERGGEEWREEWFGFGEREEGQERGKEGRGGGRLGEREGRGGKIGGREGRGGVSLSLDMIESFMPSFVKNEQVV